MANLIVLGNINQYTFANSILAAYNKSLDVFGEKLANIHIFHSEESQNQLNEKTDWINFLEQHGIEKNLFISRIVDINYSNESIENFINAIEQVIKSVPDNSNLMVDLSNGTAIQKNLFSIVSYVLDIKHQYMIDVIQLSKLTKERGFLPVDVLLSSYISTPNSAEIDTIAYLNLSEVVRYKKIIDNNTKKYIEIDKKNADFNFFKDNLIHSVKLKLQGDIKQDNAIYRIAASSISSSIEDLITLLINKFISEGVSPHDKATLGQKLKTISSSIEINHPEEFDVEFFKKFNDFMLYLRNSTTHKGKLLSDSERFKADLALKMSFSFIEFYIDVIYPILQFSNSTNPVIQQPNKVNIISLSDINKSEILYYGLDGDNTGQVLEELFVNSTNENQFKKISDSIVKAINEISKYIRNNTETKNSVIFAAGDDLLFKGYLDEDMLKTIQKMYKDITSGLTCSIGYGRSFKEVYLALKLAKTQPGKNSIIGININ